MRRVCGCGYPFDPEYSYAGRYRTRGGRRRSYCNVRCAVQSRRLARRERRQQARSRAQLAAAEAAGQLRLL